MKIFQIYIQQQEQIFIRVGMRKSKNYVILVSVIDNLIKGASGQAVQNMNVKFGFKEQDGLELQPYFL
jgi:N-acetyl-gamma-glutamyl-phosphate reductase (EC 1.2.1.38)